MRSAAKIFCPIKVLATVALLSACSAPQNPSDVHDPYEGVNRATHAVNVELDRSILRPTSQVYGTLVPRPVRTSVDNAASNLGLPSAVFNKALQGDVESAVHNFARFAVNTTLGVFGLFDPAQDFGLEEREADFGETLGVWGVREGAFLMLPLLGPSTERDTAGRIVDIVTNPVSLVYPNLSDEQLAGVIGETVNFRYEFTDTTDSILYDSADSYAQLRLFYLDSSNANETTDADLEELFDDLIFE